MEYNKLIERVQQMPIEVPDTDSILGGMRSTMHRRRKQRRLVFSLAIVLVVGTSAYFMQPRSGKTITLAEAISATLQSSPNDLPAPLAGYKNSIRNHQITVI